MNYVAEATENPDVLEMLSHKLVENVVLGKLAKIS